MNEELFGAVEAIAVALEDNARACDDAKKANEYLAQANLIWEMYFSATKKDSLSDHITSLRDHEGACWDMAEKCLREKDAGALYDKVNEIQGIQWAIRGLEDIL